MASLNHHESAKSRRKLDLHGYRYHAQTAFPIQPQSLTLKMPGNFRLTYRVDEKVDAAAMEQIPT
jgi:hypothetical protein